MPKKAVTENKGKAEANVESEGRGSFWSGSISIGLVNVPVRLRTMIYDKDISFRFLHKKDGQPLRYDRVCVLEDKVVPWEEIVKGYEVRKNEFIVLENDELRAARPESDQRIRLDKFVNYLSIDPVYFERSYILVPDKSDDAYGLLLNALQSTGKAGVGRITLRTKEYPVLVFAYKGGLILTTLRYGEEVLDPRNVKELRDLKEHANKAELDIAKRIISDLSGDFDIGEYKDHYREKIEELIRKKMKGETITFEKPVKEEAAKELMVALQETLKQLKKK